VGELVVPLLASDMGSQQPGHLAHRAQVVDQVEQALRLTADEQVWQVQALSIEQFPHPSCSLGVCVWLHHIDAVPACRHDAGPA
jgi:hypothetical protein